MRKVQAWPNSNNFIRINLEEMHKWNEKISQVNTTDASVEVRSRFKTKTLFLEILFYSDFILMLIRNVRLKKLSLAISLLY
jgi:hypothetical protein